MMNQDEESSLLGIESEPELNEELKKRFLQGNINSFIDDILVSFNSCKNSISDMDDMALQRVTASAINHLQIHQKGQCIVFTGDSGSGKTWLANNLINHITMATKTTDKDLAKHIAQAGQILEAFGNASTLTSNNSSRFIKITELLFTPEIRLKGVCFYHYLLEKTRVVQHAKGERNFHIFYKFFFDTTPNNVIEKYHLEPTAHYRYVGCDIDIQKEKDKYHHQQNLENLKECFVSLGFSQSNIETIFRLLAAILHIGDVTFCIDGSKKTVVVSDLEPLQKASSLLCVSPDKLKFSLLTEMTYVKGRIARRVRPIGEATNARDMLAMAVYDRLFAWIVWKINLHLSPIHERGNAISILDPFGFESLDVNGFEQLCINTTNEHLMFLYNQIVFAWETADHEAEGIPIQKINVPDNKDVIDILMERPNGIFSLIEQESKLTKGSDASLVKSFSTKNRKHGCYSDVANCPYPAFTIKHYTGKVTYVALDILTRNRNMLGGSIITCLQESQDDLLRRLFMVKLSSTGSILRARQQNSEDVSRIPSKADIKKMPTQTIRRKAEMIGKIYGTAKTKVNKQQLFQEQAYLTLTSQFRNSLSELMQRNLQSELHFIRCIRPNRELIPNKYDDELVGAQLKYYNVVESVHMRNNGFSVRISFKDFIRRYKFLSYQLTAEVKYNQETCEKILSHVHEMGWRIGRTKVFMKNDCRESLNSLIFGEYKAILIIQKLFRSRLARRWYHFLKQTQQKEEHEVKIFLSQIVSNDFYSHLCNQVSEEDTQANCSDIKPDEKVEEKALQILEGNKKAKINPVLQKVYKEVQQQQDTTLDDITTKEENLSKEKNNSVTQLANDLQSESSIISPLISVTDIFDYGLLPNPTLSDMALETANQSSISESPQTSNSDTMAVYSDDCSKPLSISDAMALSSDDCSTPLSISDAMAVSSDDYNSLLSFNDAMPESYDDIVTSPVRPSLASKESNISTFSFDSTLSVDDDMDVAVKSPGLWCTITCYEREKPRGDFQVDRPVIVIDGSSNAFDITRIGLGSLPVNSHDEKSEKVRRCIGKGIKLAIDDKGNMWVKRCSKNNVYVKGRFLSSEIHEMNGDLPKGTLLKVFDFESFSDLLQSECQPMRYEPEKGDNLLSFTKVYFSFVKNAIDDVDTPCWIEVKMEEPYRITQVALDKAKERRRIAREKSGERTPPILRAKIGKSRKIIAVGAFEKKVRPSHYIDTFKYGRKGWARKKVSVNPFAYGKQDYFSSQNKGADDLSRERSHSSPEKPVAGELSNEEDAALDEVFQHSSVILEKKAVEKNINEKLSGEIKQNANIGQKIWAKEKLKAKVKQKSKGRIRSKTTT